MQSSVQQQRARAVAHSTELTGLARPPDSPSIAELPITVTVGALWMVVVDAPRLISLGPISLSGGITIFVATLTLFMLPAYGLNTAARLRDGQTESARTHIPWAMWSFLWFLFIGLVITSLNGAIGISSIQNACVYLSFVGATAFAATVKSSTLVLRGWELMRNLATCSAYLMLSMSALNLNFLNNRAMALVQLVVLAVVTPGKPRGIWMKLAPFAAVAAMALSLSRTATVVGIVFLIFIVLRGKRGGRLVKSLFMLMTAAAVIYLLVVHYAPFHDRFLVGDNALQVGNLAISTQGRMTLWKLLFEYSSDNWLVGQGLGSSGRLLAEHIPARADSPAQVHPHNEYLRFYFEFGLVGLALFVSGYLALIARIFRSARQTDHPLHWAAVIALLAVGLSAITDNPFVYPFVMLPLGSLAGLSLALTRFESLDDSPAVFIKARN
jgi:O-antigen ligase